MGGCAHLRRHGRAVSYVLHDISALVMLFGIFIHVYLSTIGQPGTMQAMTRGTVSEAWGWTHAPAWYRQMTGRDPRQALEQERKRRADRERAIERLSHGLLADRRAVDESKQDKSGK